MRLLPLIAAFGAVVSGHLIADDTDLNTAEMLLASLDSTEDDGDEDGDDVDAYTVHEMDYLLQAAPLGEGDDVAPKSGNAGSAAIECKTLATAGPQEWGHAVLYCPAGWAATGGGMQSNFAAFERAQPYYNGFLCDNNSGWGSGYCFVRCCRVAPDVQAAHAERTKAKEAKIASGINPPLLRYASRKYNGVATNSYTDLRRQFFDDSKYNAPGYCRRSLDVWDDVRNQRLCESGKTQNLAFRYTINFFPQVEGVWKFDIGGDYDLGGGLYVDGTLVDDKRGQKIHWGGRFSVKPEDQLSTGDVKLAAKEWHSINVIAFSLTTDMPTAIQFSFVPSTLANATAAPEILSINALSLACDGGASIVQEAPSATLAAPKLSPPVVNATSNATAAQAEAAAKATMPPEDISVLPEPPTPNPAGRGITTTRPGEAETTKDLVSSSADQDCKLTEFSQWTRCTATCGTGFKIRSRHVSRPAAGKGKPCGELVEQKLCNSKKCDKAVANVDCVVSKWSPWSTCDRDCSYGTQQRSRVVITSRSGKGKSCPSLTETRGCDGPCAL